MKGKFVRYDVLDMCTKILELYDSQNWLDGRFIISRVLKGIESLNMA